MKITGITKRLARWLDERLAAQTGISTMNIDQQDPHVTRLSTVYGALP